MSLIKERSKQEIQAKLGTMGDYVKIDYLNRALASGLDFETRKFVLLELAKLYEARGMYHESAKLMKNAAEINTTFKGKIADYMKSVEMYIKSGNYQDADFVFAQTLALATDLEKQSLKSSLRQHYAVHAQSLIKADKRSLAKKAYEKILTMELPPQEKKQAQTELLQLYEKLGNIREFYKLRDAMQGTNKF